jgi:RHS repeat-associated protein
LVTEAGRSTAYTYDNWGNKLSEAVTDTVTGQVRTTQWTYTAQGLVETVTDAKGSVWTYGYDSAGNRTSVKNPLGQQTTYSFDAAGRVTGQADPNGLVTSYTYDIRGRLITQTRGGEASSYSYTPAGQLASASNPDGHQISYTYDAAQRLIAATDNRGATVQYTLDAMGNRVREEVKDANGNIARSTARVIDSLNRMVAIQDAQGHSTALAYDANGEQVSVTDPLQQTTRQSLDGLRRNVATTFADNNSASQAWNQLGQLTEVTDPKGVKSRYQTNAFGDVVSETSPDIGTIGYERDANGDVIKATDAKGNVATVTRDALGRPTQIHYDDQTQVFNYNTAGHVVRIDDGSGNTAYTRDLQGRVLSKTQTIDDVPAGQSRYAVQYAYSGGNLASITYPSGLQVFLRRTAGRIAGIDVQPARHGGKEQPVSALVSGLTYTALGAPKGWNWFNGDSAARAFDADGRMTQSEIAGYTYDAAGRVSSITQHLWTQGPKVHGTATLSQTPVTWSATYDNRNRLTGFARTGASSTFQYDANSNRLAATETTAGTLDLEAQFDADNITQSASQALNVDADSNRLLGFTQTTIQTSGTASSSVTVPVRYALDANGAMTSDGLRTFVYDAGGRLARAEVFKDGEAAAVSYLHNALGQRVFKSEPQAQELLPDEKSLDNSFIKWLKATFGWVLPKGQGRKGTLGRAYVYDEEGNLLGEYDNGSARSKGSTEYIWLPTEQGQAIPIGMFRNGKLYAVHSDHLGTPRLVTDADKVPVWQWPYSAFGNNRPTGALSAITANGTTRVQATTPAVEFSLRLPGQYYDEESGLNYNGFRTYDARIRGGYVQPDPTGLVAGPNRFLYVGGNPLSFTDPLGLQAILPGPGGIPIPVIPVPGRPNASPVPGWDPADGPAPAPGTGTIVWPPGFSPNPEPTGCHIETPSTPPPLPPKNNCESQLKVCTDISRSYPFGTRMAMMSACFVQYAICKKVFNHE